MCVDVQIKKADMYYLSKCNIKNFREVQVNFMSVYMKLGLYAGLICGLFLVTLFVKITKKDGSFRNKYDERQSVVRGRGYKLGFFTLVSYNIINGFSGLLLEKPLMDQFTAIMAGVCLATAIYAVYCIWHDAYFSLNDNPVKALLIFGMLGAVNLVLGSVNVMNGEAITNGVLNFRSTSFICGILFIIIFAALLAKRIKNRNGAEQETL